MRSDKIILAEIDVDIKPFIESQKALENQLKMLLDKQMEMFSSGKKNTQEYKELAQTINNLNEKYNVQAKLISEKLKANEKLIAKQKALETAITKTNKTENEYVENNKKLIKLRSELNVNSDNYQKNLDSINTKLQENNKWISENASAQTRLNTTFDGYKSQVKDSFNQINLLNGGLGGFISRAKEAGGVGPLVKGAFEGMSSGIMGMTKASLSFIATPIGAVIAAIAIVIALVKNAMDGGSESAKKITKIFNTFSAITDGLMKLLEPLGEFLIDGIAAGFELAGKAAEAAIGFISDGLSFLGFDSAAEGVKNFANEVKETANETQRLKDAQEKLTAQTTAQEIANEKAKQKISELTKKVKDQTLSEKERLKALEDLSEVEKKNLSERKNLADAAYNNAVANAAKGKSLTDEEKKQLQEGGLAYAQKMMAVKGFTQEEIDALKDAQLERMRLSSEEIQLANNTAAQKKAINNETESNEAEKRQKQRDANSEEAKRLQLNLDLYMQAQSQKEMSAEEEIAYLKNIQEQKTAIANAEFAATEKTENDRLAHQLKIRQIALDSSKEQAEVAIANANLELDNYLENHKSKITAETQLTEEIIAEENKRLEGIKEQKLKTLAVELDTNDKIIEAKKAKNQLLSEEDLAYLAQKEEIENEHKATVKENNDALEEQEKAEKVAKHEEEFQQKLALATNEYDQQRIIEDERYAQEQAQLEERRVAENLSDEQFKALQIEAEKNHTANKQAIDKAEFNNKVELAKGAYNNIATILGKESEAGKAMAIAQATIDTYKSAVSAYGAMSGIPIVGPALGALAAGAAVVAGVKNVKKIASTKPAKAPKAEKGALFNIGGQRHSAGGTLFTGADGTQFEAEQGELIGVMNRNAARHFMAFNNAFPAGGTSAPNYFANGGIVSRDIATPGLNTEELALKIAEANSSIPAPVVSVQDIVTEGDSYVQVKQGANF